MIKRTIAITILVALAAGPLLARDLDEIVASGTLVVGLRKTPTTWVVDPKTGASSGFTYELAAAFAASLGLSLEVVTIPTFADLWKKDGTLPTGYDRDPAVVYTPDLYRDADLAADILSPQPWREKLVTLVPFIENTDIVLARKDLRLASHADLAGKRTFFVAGMSGYSVFAAKLKELGMPFVEEAVTLTDLDTEPRILAPGGVIQPAARSGPVRVYIVPTGTPYRNFTGIWLIYSNQVDFGVSDYLTVLLQLWENPSFRTSVVPSFSFSSLTLPLCFAFDKADLRLQEAFGEFVGATKADGGYSALVKRYTGFTYAEYLSIMGAGR